MESGRAAQAMAATATFVVPRAVMAAPAITTPASANLGSAAPGQSTTVQLGQVRVTSSGNRTWATTVSATAFTTGGGTALETISSSRLAYASGPLVSKTGPGTFVPGQPNTNQKQPLDTPRLAFSYNTVVTNASSVIWNPTLTMSVPATAVAGTYTGSMTHSVA
ncbi:hypothetical protein [Streptomyces sporangiiformans]|uniref:WxL domain-containing protein n=1 Tax=Streptomyces sporangiiformans TaxID=2315329 RepID=A0A505DBK0_9ACTN|nr:hypothetical protein [Streptomyces sporangiiformans]TPQ17978.1 hypothetical protein FGD71_033755 [Streptomyces sporangiiformans]